MRIPSIYAKLRFKHAHRALRTPRVDRPWRPRVIAWAGIAPFMRDRFYELDPWYKARIHKPEMVPQLHLIDTSKIFFSIDEKFNKKKEKKINIGFKKTSDRDSENLSKVIEKSEMEKLSRKNQLRIDMDQIDFNQMSLFDHFNIFDDLFLPGVYFYNTQNVHIEYGENRQKVQYGNFLKGSETKNAPKVTITPPNNLNNGFSTLLMLNLDGNFVEEDQIWTSGDGQADVKEGEPIHKQEHVLQWLVSNIPDCDSGTGQGETIVPYFQPLAPYGSGYSRIVFLVFRHRSKLDFEQFRRGPLENLKCYLQRYFSTNSFFKAFEDEITPTALRFFQTRWDESCDEFLHKIGSKSPRYWYEWNQPLKPEQREFPMKPMPFQHYLNMYQPAEKVRKRIQRERLEMLVKQPESEDERVQRPDFPDILYAENKKSMPHWQHQELIKKNSGQGIYAALYSDYVNPAIQHLEEEKPAKDPHKRKSLK